MPVLVCRLQHSTSSSLRVSHDLALPDAYNRPAKMLGGGSGVGVAFAVTSHLGCPQRCVGTSEWGLAPVDWTRVPPTAIDEDRKTTAWQHDVWSTPIGQPSMEAKTNAHRVEGTTKQQFRLRIDPATPSQVPTSLGGRPCFTWHLPMVPPYAGTTRCVDTEASASLNQRVVSVLVRCLRSAGARS